MPPGICHSGFLHAIHTHDAYKLKFFPQLAYNNFHENLTTTFLSNPANKAINRGTNKTSMVDVN